MNELKVKTKGGYIRATVSGDPFYPGIDVEFVSDEDIGEEIRPRALFEYPHDGELRVLVWTDKDNEDYTHEITFD